MAGSIRVRRIDGAHRPDAGQADYADAFELTGVEGDDRSALDWLSAGLEGAPAPLRVVVVAVHRWVLRLRPVVGAERRMLLVWRLTRHDPEQAELRASGALLDARLVVRRLPGGAVVLATELVYRRPAARVVWAVVGPVHRVVAPLLVRRAAG